MRYVKHEVTPRYTPSLNGRAERAVRTITEAIRTVLIASQFPLKAWVLALEWAVTTLNITSGAFKAVFGEKKHNNIIKMMTPFGSLCTFIKEQSEKFSSRSALGGIIGYEPPNQYNVITFSIEGEHHIVTSQNVRIFPQQNTNGKEK